MAIEFTCSGCSNTLRVPDEHAGKHARCPQCSSVNTIPNQSQPTSSSGDGNPNLGSPAPFGALPSQQQQPPQAAQPAVSNNPYQQPIQPQYGQQQGYAPQGGYQHRHYAPHRGGLILTLGILSFFCNFLLIPGIMAWVMGRADMKEIKAGRMDPAGEGITMAGMIIGIISTALVGLIAIFYIVIIIIAIGAGAAGM